MQFKRALNDGTVDLDQANLTANLRSYMDMGVKVYSQEEKEERDDVIDKARENILQRMRQENQISQVEANKMKAKHDRYTTEYMKPIMENARKTRQEAVKAETQWLLAQSKLGGDKAQEAVERIGEIKRKADRNRGEAHVKRMEGKTREVVLPGAAPQNAGAQAGQNAAAGQLIGQRPGVPTAPSIQVQRPGVPVAPSIQVQRPELPGSPAVQPEGVPGAQPAQLQEPGIPGALPVPGQQPLDAQPAQLQQPGIPGALPVPGQQPLGAQPAQLQRPGIPGAPLVPGQQPLGAQSAQGQPQAAALQQHTIKVEEQTDDISERRSEDFQQLVLIESEISDNAARGGVNRLKKYLYERNERSAEKKKQDADKKADSAASEIKKCAERWNGIREKYRTDTFHKIYQAYDTHASAYYSYTRTMENRSIAADASKKIAEYTGVYDESQLTDIEALLKEDPFADVKLDYVPKTGLSADSLSTESEDHLVKFHRTMVMNAFAAGVNNLTQEKETERQQVRMKVMNNFRGYTAKNQFTDTTYTAMRDSGITAADRGKVTRADVDAAIAAARPAQAAPAAA
ncbi:MAG: hypothetical protein K5697_12645, partial [Lachnospiraceae bacterium]|nr:hypothetical protein [Lachnospiraceae bacterium]